MPRRISEALLSSPISLKNSARAPPLPRLWPLRQLPRSRWLRLWPCGSRPGVGFFGRRGLSLSSREASGGRGSSPTNSGTWKGSRCVLSTFRMIHTKKEAEPVFAGRMDTKQASCHRALLPKKHAARLSLGDAHRPCKPKAVNKT